MSKINWGVKSFRDLSKNELYDLLALRSEVFVVEQDCAYQDLDEKDKEAHHVLGFLDEKIVATARILNKGLSYDDDVSIGRVVTSAGIRDLKKGHELMNICMQFIKKEYPFENCRISAQSHLENYYGKHGFVATGKKYLEDGIPHSEMFYEVK
jgi:ElaA protein